MNVEERLLVGSRADDDRLKKSICVDRNREGIDTGLGEGFTGIGRREAELIEGNLLVLHDESPVSTETRFMGLTPKGPRPLPSAFPSQVGAPKARQVRRVTRVTDRSTR